MTNAEHDSAAQSRDQQVAAARPAWCRRCQPIRKIVALCWDCFLRFALVIWVARVPVTSTGIGLLLLGVTPQAQDLFVEFAVTPWWWRALFILWFLLILMLVWALPTHYAARMLLDTDRRHQKSIAKERHAQMSACLASSSLWVPRVLGLLTFVAIEIAILRSWINLPTLDEGNITAGVMWALCEVALLVAAAAALFLLWVIKRHELVPPHWFVVVNKKIAFFWQWISPGRTRESIDEELRDVGRFVLLGVFVIFIAIFYFGADRVAMIFPRALAVPFILGGWLPFLSWLSGVGRQWRAPLITGLAALIALLVLVLGDNHSVRLVKADAAAGANIDHSPLPLENAVKQWMKENHCGPPNDENSQATPCPRPIIVAGAGGASRAGFFIATVLGYLLQEAPNHGLDSDAVRQRLFALSSVSGGSVGAVMITAALNAETTNNEHPCVTTAVDQWWGEKVGNWRDCFEALTSGDFLTADFFGFAFNDMAPLGPWRDRAAVLEDSWRNRYRDVAVRANKAATPPSCQGLDCPFLSLRPRPGHWIPLLVLNGTSEATGGRIVTTSLAMTYAPKSGCPTAPRAGPCPLFVEAANFHHLLRQPVELNSWWGWLGFLARYLKADHIGDDVLLSTAAHNSARFPFISPPGSIRSQTPDQNQMVVDRIVDGGYFENYGALGAKELALAVHAVEPTLNPLVIVLSNDPADLLDTRDDAEPDSQPPSRPAVYGGELISDTTALLTTFANARTAHGILGVAELQTRLHKAIPECGDLVVVVRVWPDHNKTLSMSWWESSVVQRQLHRQTEQCANSGKDCVSSPRSEAATKGADENQNLQHLNAIWQAMTSPYCAPPK